MNEDNTQQQTTGAGMPNPETTTAGTTTRRKAAKTPVHPITELDEMSPKNMSESEMRVYIGILRERNQSNTVTIESLKQNCDSAYNKAKYMEEQLGKTVQHYEGIIAFVKQAVGTCHSSILLATSNN